MNEQSLEYDGNSEDVELISSSTLITRSVYEAVIKIVEFKCDTEDVRKKMSIPREDGYLILFNVRNCPKKTIYSHNNIVGPLICTAGSAIIYDLLENLYIDMSGPFHFFHFYLPRKVLNAIADELQVPRICELVYNPEMGVEDPVLQQLFTSLLPYMGRQNHSNSLFVDHVALAVSAHVAQVYGNMQIRRRTPRGGLAPWQERKAKELLTASIEESISLSRLAEECRLSVRHFARAFRKSTGVSPHRWGMEQRVEQAKALLGNSELPISSIALSCGFSDQSHFTRVYSALVGMSPGAWRRTRIQA